MVMMESLSYSLKNSHHPIKVVAGLGLVAFTSLLASNGEQKGDLHRRRIQKYAHVSE